MIHHHPTDDLLLQLAAGRLSAGPALVLRVHLESCTECRARLHTLEAVGGALLEEAEALPLAADAWSRTLERIDALDAASRTAPARAAAPAGPALRLPPDLTWPRALRDCTSPGWRWMGPDMWYAKLHTPADPAARLFLLRIGAGRELPKHTHTDLELTQVLYGRFDDGRATFGAGDFDAAGGEVHHQPHVLADGTCICLASVEGSLRFDGRVARLIGGWVGM